MKGNRKGVPSFKLFSRSLVINIEGYTAKNGDYPTLRLASLPAGETFKSHTINALEEDVVSVQSNSFTISVPKLSTTAVILNPTPTGINNLKNLTDEIKLFPNPVNDILNIRIKSIVTEPSQITIVDQTGRTVISSIINFEENVPITINTSSFSQGFYFVSVKNNHFFVTQKFVKY